MRHIHDYKLIATYKMTLTYFLVNIHFNSQSTLHKMNNVVKLGGLHIMAISQAAKDPYNVICK